MSPCFDFSVVVPTFNNRSETKACVESVLGQRGVSFELLLCDNGSEDGTAELCEAYASAFDVVRFFQHPDKGNHGRAANRNQALGRLRGKYVLFLDADMVACEGLLLRHFEQLEKRPCVSVGKVVYEDEGTNFWAGYLAGRGVGKHRVSQPTQSRYFTTQNSAMPSQWFEAVGGFDAEMKAYGGDDTEFAIRLEKAFGLVFFYNEQAVARSVMGKSVEKALGQLEEFGSEGLRHIHNKHPECQDVFWLGLFTGKGLKSKLFRALLRGWVYELMLAIFPKVPKGLAYRLFNYCVAYRIFKGFGKA